MKNWILLISLCLFFFLFSPSGHAQIYISTQLTVNQEVPPVSVGSSGTGTGFFILNDDMTELQFEVSICDLTGPIVAAHFHRDRAGKAGPVVRTITSDFSGNTASGVWKSTDSEPLTPDLAAALLEGEIYLNVHTTANAPGEIRGQLGNLGFTAKLDTTQEIPPPSTPSSGTGTGSFSLNPAMNELKFDITVDSLTGTIGAAHFHIGAAGAAGPVVKTITGDFTGNTASGYWRSTDAEPLTDALVQALLADSLYINVHTAANGPGEIRGQVVLDTDIHLTTQLTVNQEVPPVTAGSEGTGTAAFSLDDSMTGLQFDLTVTNLTGPIAAAHFHMGAPGQAGPVVRTITGDFVGNTASGKWESTDSEPLTPDLVKELLKGNLYLNVHTAANAPGELRGQIGDRGFGAKLDTTQEVPPVSVSSSGTGTAAIRLNPAMNEVKFDVTVCDLTGSITAAHFHKGASGSAGPVVRTITGEFNGNTATGVWTPSDAEPLTPDLIADLIAGNLYLNVHTAANPPGEIRGQVNPPGLVTSVERFDDSSTIPENFTLFQNFPNPFNPTTEIRFALTSSGKTVLKVYNLVGQEVVTLVNEDLPAGTYKATFEASELPTGVYVYQLEYGGARVSRKMILLK
ncbi:MAG: CHRD domain-containing protein [bacterium]